MKMIAKIRIDSIRVYYTQIYIIPLLNFNGYKFSYPPHDINKTKQKNTTTNQCNFIYAPECTWVLMSHATYCHRSDKVLLLHGHNPTNTIQFAWLRACTSKIRFYQCFDLFFFSFSFSLLLFWIFTKSESFLHLSVYANVCVYVYACLQFAFFFANKNGIQLFQYYYRNKLNVTNSTIPKMRE